VTALQALLFDVDGTLADTERDGHRVAFNRAFADAGLDWVWSPQLYGELLAVTGGKERIRYYLDQFNTTFQRPDDLAGFIQGLHAAKTEHYTRMLAEGAIPLRSGVKRLIEEARAAGLRLAVATTTTPANVEALLTHALAPEAMSWFEVIAAGDVVPAKKPAPDIYFYAMEQLKLQPADCIAFEDSHNGILSSRGADLKTIIAVNGYTADDDFSGAAIVLDQWGEPDAPFTVLNGVNAHLAGESRCLDLDLVKRLHAA
jgi:HAD superfamily hydrolase (TIGR01509 family)